jgi:hypothetical protein
VTFDIVKNMGASVRQLLLNYAKASGSPFTEVLQYYAMERDADYAGVRTVFIGRVNSARVHMQIDIGFGE